MLSVKRVLTLAILLLSASGLCFSQQGMGIVAQFDERFRQLDSLIFTTVLPVEDFDAADAHAVFGMTHSVIYDSLYNAAVQKRTNSQIAEINAETGLQATGQVYARLDNAFNADDEEDPMSVYRAKVQAELRWYVLQSRIYKHQGRVREQQLKGEIDMLAHEKERTDLTIYKQKEMLRWHSDSILASLLMHRVANLDLLQQANSYLLHNENISSDELLKILDEKAQAERQLATMAAAFPAAKSLAPLESWVVEIDTTALLTHIDQTQIDLRLMQLRIQLLEQQADNEGWWRTTRIAPFIRYSGYYTSANTISTNIDAGVSFTIPINDQSRRTRQSILADKEVVEAEAMDLKSQIRDKVRFIVQEIGRLNRASVAEAARVGELREYLAMRGDAYRNRMGEYSRLSRMKEYNAYLSSLEKLVDFQYRRDVLISDLQAFLVDDTILRYCHPSKI